MTLWQSIRPYLSGLVRFFHISYIEAKSEHRGTHLGIFWIPLSSLLFAAMLALVFHHADSMSVLEFFFYVFAGYIFWNFIADSITGSTDVIQGRFEFAIHNNLSLAGLFGKLLIDRLFAYLLNLAVLVILIAILSPWKLGVGLLLFFPFIALTVVTSLGTAYLVNMMTIFFPDLKALIAVGTRFMFFASPVFWSAAEGGGGVRGFLVKYNPAAYFLSLPRQVFGIEPIDAKAWLVAAIVSAVVCLVGYLAYHQSQGFVRNLK
ncbi:ABC transporter permease [Aquamicrobium sp. LC103]|uniref:ABC transporter permease n=1 Tax=Aquamicrobium sp. LC103 TaxID=1120658 RepID=UPI00063E909F|nr:ABC transporter permease [Aquamicrobium sp. LC103]TKT82412.1 ABC transporter [Aquamicrobium sp. LC103]